ncbi:hypothetical protein HOI18_04500 [Candidatus Uhrbacteria bacterium]|jgi:hypothetical protein|nr:hypothetical protein [Candidatus Uhrbacteria bacterium]
MSSAPENVVRQSLADIDTLLGLSAQKVLGLDTATDSGPEVPLPKLLVGPAFNLISFTWGAARILVDKKQFSELKQLINTCSGLLNLTQSLNDGVITNEISTARNRLGSLLAATQMIIDHQ